ncbi:hypothetical protein NECAME_13566 [Necator americanus]|uniref:Uncharacterized protein n=1 Tax=Necator americanus TaxID=51031 RepID=W2SWU4_NECAM|nr:hypothetical protein NECAME_13566 [Necator americanus]ETN73271.1 hypothetical protein NECAME_13566 [Necator americanus]
MKEFECFESAPHTYRSFSSHDKMGQPWLLGYSGQCLCKMESASFDKGNDSVAFAIDGTLAMYQFNCGPGLNDWIDTEHGPIAWELERKYCFMKDFLVHN